MATPQKVNVACACVATQEGGQEEEEADVEASIFEQYLSVCDQGTVDPET